MQRSFTVAAVSALVLAAASAAHGAPLYSIDFSQPRSAFTFFRITFENEPTGLDATFDLLAADGNPNDRSVITHFYSAAADADANAFVSVQTVALYNPVTYNPAVSGAISSITLSIDAASTQPGDSLVFAVGLPDGSGFFAGFTSLNPDGLYNTYTATLTQSDVAGAPFAGNQPLTFGFGLFTNLNTLPGQTASSAVSFDNFSVSVAPIPEPTYAALLTPAALLLRRRRRA